MNLTKAEAATILEAFVICSSEGLSPAIAAGAAEITESTIFDKIVAKYPLLFKKYVWLADEYRNHGRRKNG